jgi:transcriptional regulator GlxA family with amidase domain
MAGPWDVFNAANLLAGLPSEPYRLELLSCSEDRRVETVGGMHLVGRRNIRACRGPIDTLIVPASFGFERVTSDRALIRQVQRLARHSRRVASVCGGAFVLAAAGLLDGRRATTHWRGCEELARRYPAVKVEPDRIFVKDGNVYTSAGVTAGIDLALALVEEDLGRGVALSVAQDLVMFLRRPGGQTQFSRILQAQNADRQPLQELLARAAERPDEELTVEAMAARSHMSPRNFARVFVKQVGKTPARFIEQVRVDAARRRLEETNSDLECVADGCGFGSANSMRRSFLRVLGVTPGAYRERFRRG